MDDAATSNTSVNSKCLAKETSATVGDRETVEFIRDLREIASQVEETTAMPSEEFSPQVRLMFENMCGQETVLTEEPPKTNSELCHLEEELELLKEAVRMALDNEHPVSFHMEQLNEQIETRRCHLQELRNKWEVITKPLEEKRWNLLESFCVDNPVGQIKLQRLKEIKMETQKVFSEIRKREVECAKLADELEKQPKVASRRSYLQRITEITKNSKKLDADIERILRESRELKLESNLIEERLHRTYAVVDDTIFREAKTDSVGRQAYRLLTSIHQCFEEICEQILAADKARREFAELEAKLSVIASRSLVADKLQADLDAMRIENEHLEIALRNR